MWIFLVRRLVALPPLLVTISLLTYLLLQLAPGDFFRKLEENPTVEQDYVMNLRRSAGKVVEVDAEDRAGTLPEFTLDGVAYGFAADGGLLRDGEPADPRTEQERVKRFEWPEGGDTWTVTERGRVYRWVGAIEGYAVWLGNVVTGDLGESFLYKTGVGSVIGERLLNTLLLSLAALAIAWGLAIPLGVISGVRPNSVIDHSCGAVAYFGLSVPSVFLALLAVLFAYYTGWFPAGNARDVIGWDHLSPVEKVLDIAHHLVLPASVAGLAALAGYMRQMRGQMVETMSADFVRTARAKGVSHRVVVFKHALRNAINPLVTLFGFSLASLLSGSVLVEVVMNWPGLGRLVVDAVFAKDEPLVLAATMMTAVLLVMGNLVADILLGVVDPRIRVE